MSTRWPAAIAALEDICRVLTRADLILYPLQAKVFFGVTPSYPPTRAATVLAEAEWV